MKLQDVLKNYKVDRLRQIADCWSLEGISRLNKGKLIERLSESMLETNRLELILMHLNTDEMDRLRHRKGCFEQEDLYSGLSFLLDCGFIVLLNDREYEVPDELYERVHQLDTTELRKKQERLTRIRKYAMAFIELYGIIPAEKAAEIYYSQTGDTLTGEELLDMAGDPIRPFQYTEVYNNSLAHVSLWAVEDDDSEAEELRERQANVPYYIPTQEELLDYSDDRYYERNAQYDALLQFIRRRFDVDEDRVEDICEDIQLGSHMELELNYIISDMERMGAFFQSKKQFEEFLTYLVNLMKHTRLWSLRGHTPAELNREHPTAAAIREQLAVQPREVGRNDPCPCGSGKKYKKCCGAKN